LNIATSIKHGVLIVRVAGELDMHVADELRQTIDEALDASGAKNILFSLKGVTFIDSSGLGVILGRYKKINLLGGRLAAANVPAPVARILRLSGVLQIMQVYDSETQALERL
jgi:stage II sporulation protein AA (anti-sigma F factor antagonist)